LHLDRENPDVRACPKPTSGSSGIVGREHLTRLKKNEARRLHSLDRIEVFGILYETDRKQAVGRLFISKIQKPTGVLTLSWKQGQPDSSTCTWWIEA